jgi:uncharacterized repeat protein (TIGR01451 family)
MKPEALIKLFSALIISSLLLATIFLLPSPASADAPICSAPDLAIPDGSGQNVAGTFVTDTIQITDPAGINDLNLSISTTHPYVGDLIFILTHKVDASITSSIIFSRPYGIRPSGEFSEPACTGNNIDVILDDEASLSVQNDCNETIPDSDIEAYIVGGSYRPYTDSLKIFYGDSLSGTWELAVNDNFITDTGTLHSWCIMATTPPDLQISKNDGVTSVTPGGTITYTLTYTNKSGTANNTVITETVPANTTFVPAASTAGWVCTPNNNAGSTCTLDIGDLINNTGGSATFVVTIANPLPAGVATITNTVQIGDDGTNDPDQNPGDNSDTELTSVNAAPDLQINKDDAGLTINPGGTITYTLTYTNAGNQNATGVVLTETLPLYTSFNSATPAGWHQVGATNQYTYSVGNLDVGPSQAITFVVTVDSSPPDGVTNISNTAQIGDDKTNGADGNSSNNSDTETTGLAGLASTQEEIFLPIILKTN